MSGRLTLVVVLIVLGLTGICFAHQGIVILGPDAAQAGPQRTWHDCRPNCPPMGPPPPATPYITIYGHHLNSIDHKCGAAVWKSFMQRKAVAVDDPRCAAVIHKALKIAREHDKASPTPTPSASASSNSR